VNRLKRLAVLSLGIAVAVPALVFAHDYANDSRKATTALNAGDDQVVSFTYAPMHWRPETFDSIAGNERMRTSFNTQRLPKIVAVKASQGLTFGDAKVPAGDCTAGFNVDEKGTWYFIVNDKDGKTIAKTALTLNKTGDTYDHLEMVALPGATANGGVLKVRYGTWSGNVEFTYGASQ